MASSSELRLIFGLVVASLVGAHLIAEIEGTGVSVPGGNTGIQNATIPPATTPVPYIQSAPNRAVVLYAAPSEGADCRATVVVNPRVAFPTPLIYPPPMVVSARAYFLLRLPFAFDPHAPVYVANQDRLWPVPDFDDHEGGRNVTATFQDPCPGINVAVSSDPAFPGLSLRGLATAEAYSACLQRVSYQNTAAWPCPPSPADGGDPRLVRCMSPQAPPANSGFVPGPREVAFEIAYTVSGSSIANVDTLADGSSDGPASEGTKIVVLGVGEDSSNAANCAAGTEIVPLPLLLPSPPRPSSTYTAGYVPTGPGTLPGTQCMPSVLVDPGFTFFTTLIYPPPLGVEARAYFLPGVNVNTLPGGDRHALPVNNSVSVVARNQDRLWVQLDPAAETAGTPLQPCPGLALSSLNESDFFGVKLTGLSAISVYSDCLRRLTYSNVVAFPCPMTPWDGLDPSLTLCRPGPTAVSGLIFGPRVVAVDVRTVVPFLPVMPSPDPFPAKPSESGRVLFVLDPMAASSLAGLMASLADNCARSMWAPEYGCGPASEGAKQTLRGAAQEDAITEGSPDTDTTQEEEDTADSGSESDTDPYTKTSSGSSRCDVVRMLTLWFVALTALARP